MDCTEYKCKKVRINKSKRKYPAWVETAKLCASGKDNLQGTLHVSLYTCLRLSVCPMKSVLELTIFIFSCKDAAQQVLMSSVCLSVCPSAKLKLYILTAFNVFHDVPECSRMFQNVPECMQNVPECSRIHADVPEFSRMHAEYSRTHAESSRLRNFSNCKVQWLTIIYAYLDWFK